MMATDTSKAQTTPNLTLADLSVTRPDEYEGGTIPGAVIARLLTAQPPGATFTPDPEMIAQYMRGLADLLWDVDSAEQRTFNADGVYLAHELLTTWARWLDPLVTDPERFAAQYRVTVVTR